MLSGPAESLMALKAICSATSLLIPLIPAVIITLGTSNRTMVAFDDSYGVVGLYRDGILTLVPIVFASWVNSLLVNCFPASVMI
jgi:hypothetical protein